MILQVESSPRKPYEGHPPVYKFQTSEDSKRLCKRPRAARPSSSFRAELRTLGLGADAQPYYPHTEEIEQWP